MRAPRLRAASTNSRSRSDSVWPRMIRPMYGQLKNPMITMMRTMRSVSPCRPNAWSGMTPTSASANSSIGKARKTSIVRLIRVSTQPPKYPATTPATVPITTASSVAKNAMSSEIRAP